MRTLLSFALAALTLLLLAGPVAAHDPTGGALREYAPGTTLLYRYGGTGYPAWIQSATQTALGSDWSATSYNNSRLPQFAYSGGGGGAVYYSSSASSPCGTGNTQWLQCASGWGSTAWRIYVRNFNGAPYGSWTWCNVSFTGTCWDAERALLHEAEHVTLGIGNHDAQGESNTVMGSVSPWYPNAGWNTHHIQRCDHAAAQLRYGMSSAYGSLAECFDHVAGHGAIGLLPSLTASTTVIAACLSHTATLSGSFGIAADSRYQALAAQRLGGRTVWFDRKPHTGSAWTMNVASATTGPSGTNWSRGFATSSSSTISYDFRPHAGSETGLDAATGPVITVTWTSGC
jgi:hypothetical protein